MVEKLIAACLSTVLAAAPALAAPRPTVLKSFSNVTNAVTQTITLRGTGFGKHVPYSGTSNFIAFNNESRAWQAGYAPNGNHVGLVVVSWGPRQIVIGGFGGGIDAGHGGYLLLSGDTISFQVWNPKTGAASAKCSWVVDAGPVRC